MSAISTLRNLGPATEAAFRKAGIHTVEELRALGADMAYARLLDAGERPHFIGFYVLHMALQDRPWNDCKGEEKAALRLRFDSLKARHLNYDVAGIEAHLDTLGVGRRR